MAIHQITFNGKNSRILNKIGKLGSMILLASSACLAQPSRGSGGPLGTFAGQKMIVNGVERSYRLVAPTNLNQASAVPLVFALHGLFDNQELMPLYTFLDVLAAEQGFILVYPNAHNGIWSMAGGQYAAQDLAFFDEMYAKFIKSYNIDLNRVYLAGMSMGAYFTHILASERSEKIAAVLVHSGTLGLYMFFKLAAAHKYAVLVVHGAADTIVDVTEGRRTRELYTQWGHPVEYIEVPKWGHLWASVIDVNHRMWTFFMTHPR